MGRHSSPGAGLPSALLDIHRRNNLETAGETEGFGPHRARVTALASDAAPASGAGRLCVLGAGNGNDLDVAALVTRYAHVHLVDVDAAAVQRAVDRLPAAVRNQVAVHAPLDVTGAFKKLPEWRASAPTPGQLAHLPDRAVEAVAPLGTFDVVLSTCLLSQMVWTCWAAIGERHPNVRDVGAQLVLGHLRAMAHLLAPGGRGVLVVDTTSHDLYPLDAAEIEAGAARFLEEVEQSKAFFAGTNPGLLRSMFARDAALAALVDPPALVEPWLWAVGPGRTFLVYALTFTRRPDAV